MEISIHFFWSGSHSMPKFLFGIQEVVTQHNAEQGSWEDEYLYFALRIIFSLIFSFSINTILLKNNIGKIPLNSWSNRIWG